MSADGHGRLASRVLVVEDDTSLGGGLVAMLAGVGREVRWAQTAAEARRSFGEVTPDLVLLDLGLPDADGLDLFRGLREAQPGPAGASRR